MTATTTLQLHPENRWSERSCCIFFPLTHGAKMSMDGERQRDAGAPEFPLPWYVNNLSSSLWVGLTTEGSECRALDGPICDLRLLRSPWSEWGWISLGRAACTSGTAEGTGVRLVSVCHSQTCVLERSNIHFTCLASVQPKMFSRD